MKPKLSVLIPVYNEEANLRPLFDELTQVLFALSLPFEIIFVDDGSADSSPWILHQLSQAHEFVTSILFRRNAGQTSAFDAGFCRAQGEIIVTMDSDRQNDPHDIPKMLAMLEDGDYDFIAGWRRIRRDGFVLRTFPSRIANRMIRQVTGTKIHDLGCSLKLYRRELAQELRLYGEMHRFIGVLMEGLGAKVGEFEVNHRPRVAGESKYNLTRTFKVLIDLLTVWFMQGYRTKPSYIFGGIGASLVGLSGLIAGFVLWEKFALDAWVHRNPLFVVAIFFAVLGVQFLALGLLAELVIRTYFESSGQKPYHIMTSLPHRSPKTLAAESAPIPSLLPPSPADDLA